MTDIRLIDLPSQHTAVVRARVPLSELPAFFGRAYETTLRVIRQQRAAPVGPPFARYDGPPDHDVQVEAGFPLSSQIEDADGVVASTLPGGRAAEAVHVGPYETLTRTYAEIEQWMLGQGLQPGRVMWETYLTDPADEPDPATWRTLVVWPCA